MSMKNRKVLITGANGLLGQKLVEKLLEDKQVSIHASGLGASRLPAAWDGKYVWHSLDITENQEVFNLVALVKPDTIIHTAAMTNVDTCEENKAGCVKVNIDAVYHFLAACEGQPIHFIHLSTDFIFDGKNGPYDETASANPVNYYGWSKLEAEKLVMDSAVNWAIIRTVLVYGIAHDMSRSNIILWVKKSLEEGKTIQVVDDQWRTPTLAEDLADGCLLVMKKEAKGVFNISGKDFLTPYQMAMMTAEYFGLDASLIKKTDSTQFKQTAARPIKTGFILKKAKDELGYSPKSFIEGIGILAKQLKLADY